MTPIYAHAIPCHPKRGRHWPVRALAGRFDRRGGDLLRNRASTAVREVEGRTGRMTQFVGTHTNRLDAKGRVSIPAPFRTVLREREVGLVLRPSHQRACIEAWPSDVFEALQAPLQRLDMFSEEQDDLAATLFADAWPIEADKEGRIVLPECLKEHAGLSDAVVFMGLGRTFQIWEPVAAEKRRAEARTRVKERGMTLPAGPLAAAGNGVAAK